MKMVHQVDVMNPPDSIDDRGQEVGQDSIYLPKVPCSIEPLTTREQEVARQTYATATYKVTFYGNPKKPITHRHWLRQKSVSNPSEYRRIEIGSALDVRQNGELWECLCGEVVE